MLELVVRHGRGKRHADWRFGFGVGRGRSGAALKTVTVNGVSVVTKARGFTLYSFAPDTATRCTGAYAQIWPPVTGPAAAGQASPERSA